MQNKQIPDELLNKIISKVENAYARSLPFYERGIKIDKLLISITLEILNEEPTKTLPQNCRNDILGRTPDGLDARLKERLGNLHRANIISDVLAKAGVVKVISVENFGTRNYVKGTRLNSDWVW